MRYLTSRKDDDMVDRMNYLYTPNALLAFSVLISFKQFGGRPLDQDSYFVRPDVDVELVKEDERYEETRRLSYYQWVPFLFLLQAACFRLPSFLWKCASVNSGIRVHEIVERASDPQNIEEETRKKNIDTLTTHITKALRFQRRMNTRNVVIHRAIKCLNLRYKACFISYMYLVTKILYLVNVWAQFYLMNWFLNTDQSSWYGLDVIIAILGGREWKRSGYFPRVSICDFTIRQVANIQKYSVQCVLVINIFNEKIFILLWFWYIILAIATVVSFLYWCLMIAFSEFGKMFIKSNLELSDLEWNGKKKRKEIKTFVDDYLKQDGVFVLRMVSMHAGVIFATELVASLFKTYHNIEEKKLPIPSNYQNNQQQFISSLRKRKRSNTKDKNDEIEDHTTLLPIESIAGNRRGDDETGNAYNPNVGTDAYASTDSDIKLDDKVANV
uniref:Innexin n=1 Tax=Panagrolaimus sp. PS1159 TaxID=55785 RepID=A0AC35GD58_9BILA